jgi:UDP-2-acetamido-2,6-beta-L-arabino-hexul-4-ose reductase
MNVLVTGARGFIGRNLTIRLQAREGCFITAIDRENSSEELRGGLEAADIVYHLAGVNRPDTADMFETGNAGLTREICRMLREADRRPVIVMSSSILAELENPYGVSKRHAEAALGKFAAETGADVRIYRLRNVFGKWCRPNYNSVVATFCYNIANDLPIQISNPNRALELVYVDDVVKAFLAELPIRTKPNGDRDIPFVKVTLGDLAGRIQSFRDMRTSLLIPDFGVSFNQQLYATYLSYVPIEARRQNLEIKSDQRGALAEFVKSTNFGQMFISRTRPGVTRGNHYHHTKTEKFFVVEGEGIIRMRSIENSGVVEYRVRGDGFQVIDIPPGYAHSIQNVGPGDMVTLFWASEIFDPDRPDTYYHKV